MNDNRSQFGRKRSSGFTLVEMLVVIAIIGILATILIIGLPGLKGAGDMTKAADDIAGALEQARTHAMANNTYAWVGFFEEDPTLLAPSTPAATGGTGQLVIAVVASTDGTDLRGVVVKNTLTALPATLPGVSPAQTSLYQTAQIIKIPNIHLTTPTLTPNLSVASLPRPDFSSTTGSGTPTVQLGDPTVFTSLIQFNYPLTGTAKYNFSQVIQYSPQGDASLVYGTPTQLIEICLQPAHGNLPDTKSKNLIVIQIAGIGGGVTIYRP